MGTREPAYYRDIIAEIADMHGGLGDMALRRMERELRDGRTKAPYWLRDLELESWLGNDICYHAKLAGRSELLEVPGTATASDIHLTFYLGMKHPDHPVVEVGAITIKLVSLPDLRDLGHLVSAGGLDRVADIIKDASGLDVGPLKYYGMNGKNIEVVGIGQHLDDTVARELDPVLTYLANPGKATLNAVRAAARNG